MPSTTAATPAAEKAASSTKPAKRAAKPKPAAKAPKQRSAESLAAKRATQLRDNGRAVGPVQVTRVLAGLALAKDATAADVVKASGAKSMTHLKAMATGKDADVSPLRELGAKVPDGYAKGRWLACLVLAIAEQR